MVIQDFMLNCIYKGEISTVNITHQTYLFSLKDESGTIACVMFAGAQGGLSLH